MISRTVHDDDITNPTPTEETDTMIVVTSRTTGTDSPQWACRGSNTDSAVSPSTARDQRSGAEHYVVRYRPGTRAQPHRHSAAHTIVVLDGHLMVDGQLLGPGGYAYHPGGTTMLHEPAADEGCAFVLIFDGPFGLQLSGSHGF